MVRAWRWRRAAALWGSAPPNATSSAGQRHGARGVASATWPTDGAWVGAWDGAGSAATATVAPKPSKTAIIWTSDRMPNAAIHAGCLGERGHGTAEFLCRSLTLVQIRLD